MKSITSMTKRHPGARFAMGLLAGWLAGMPAYLSAAPQVNCSGGEYSDSANYEGIEDYDDTGTLDAETSESDFDCVIMPNEIVDISAGVSGRLDQVLVERGDTITKNQLVAELESRVEKASARLARERAAINTEVRLRQTSLAYDRVLRDRTQTLYDRNVVATQERDQVKKDAELAVWLLRDAEDKKRLAELEYARALELLRLKSIYSPISGTVVERYKAPGEFVDEDPIIRIAQLDPLRVEAIVPVELYGEISRALVATITAETEPNSAREARVTLIDPMADPASGTFRVRLELPNSDHKLLGGIKCKTRFVKFETPAATPEESLTHAVHSSATVSKLTDFHQIRPIAALGSVPSKEPTDTKSLDIFESPDDDIAVDQALAELSINVSATNDRNTVSYQVTDNATLLATSTVNAASCQSIGPFNNRSEASRAAQNLTQEKLLNTGLREAFARLPNGYIVLATPTDRDAFALAESMRERGVVDLLVMQYGPYEGRIALGTYVREKTAAQRRAELAALGFLVEVEARTKSQPVWYVDLQATTSAVLASDIPERLADSLGTATVSACPDSVALGSNSVATVTD